MSQKTLDRIKEVRQGLQHHLREVDKCIRQLEILIGIDAVATSNAIAPPKEAIISAKGVKELLGISSTTLSRYQQGNSPKSRPPFPKPCWYKGRSPHWKAEELIRWSTE